MKLTRSTMRLISHFITLILLNTALISKANFASNGFLVQQAEIDFTKTISSGECRGVISYPILSHADEELTLAINNEIEDFVELYALCNQDERSYYSVTFDIPESGELKFFSVRWLTKKKDKLWRVDVLNFHRNNGKMVEIDDIFNLLSNNLMSELIAISSGHLDDSCSWEEFLDKIKQREIQFYLKNKKWFIVFNTTKSNDILIEQELPLYFLKGSDHDRG